MQHCFLIPNPAYGFNFVQTHMWERHWINFTIQMDIWNVQMDSQGEYLYMFVYLLPQ